MAGDRTQKTEKPTARRRKKARTDGQVVRSQDLVPWLLVFIATFVIPSYISVAGDVLITRLVQVQAVAAEPTTAAAGGAIRGALFDLMTLTFPVLIGAAVISLAASIAQTGLILSAKAVKPQPKRLNPIAGLKRLVSVKGQWEAVKASMRLCVVGFVAVPMVLGVASDLGGRSEIEFGSALGYVGGRLLDLARMVSFLGLIISAADYAVQRRNHMRDLKMTKQEVKDEQKQSDGDPLVKGRIRRNAQQLSRNRMLAGAGDATVIVVNPTHFSVALRYDESMGVPVVVAKGVGGAALRLRSKGLAANVPVVECKPLARALFRVCDVGTAVPNELFQGVAVLLAFVQRLGHRRSLGGVHVMPHDMDALALPDRVREAATKALAASANGSQTR